MKISKSPYQNNSSGNAEIVTEGKKGPSGQRLLAEGNLQYYCYKVLHTTTSWFRWIRNQTTPLFTAQAFTPASIDANKLGEVQIHHLCGPAGFIQKWLWLSESCHGLSSHSHLHTSLCTRWLQSNSFPWVQNHDPLLMVPVHRHCVVVSPEHLSRKSILVGYLVLVSAMLEFTANLGTSDCLYHSLEKLVPLGRYFGWKEACGRSSGQMPANLQMLLWANPSAGD